MKSLESDQNAPITGETVAFTNPTASTGSTGYQYNNKLIGCAYGIATQQFLARYRAQVETSFTTPLRLQSTSSNWGGQNVTPGCVVRIVARSTGSPVFDFYCTKVVHTISSASSRCCTQWWGCYCRPATGIPGVIPAPTYNPMYTATGVGT